MTASGTPSLTPIQPALVDAGHRGRSQERSLPHQGIGAQAYVGPKGTKSVVRHDDPAPGRVEVWFAGRASSDATARDAAAIVADGYQLFPVRPHAARWSLVGQSDRSGRGGRARAGHRRRGGSSVRPHRHPPDPRARPCRRGSPHPLHRPRRPADAAGSGSASMGSTPRRAPVAEVDTWDHVRRGGISWPTRFRVSVCCGRCRRRCMTGG